jgi:CDP-glucose 4,6-dehydratase
VGQWKSTLENLELRSVHPDCNFWPDKRVLLTGHTGFKGAWLVMWLNRLGAKVTGISLEPSTTPNLFNLANIHDSCDSHFCDIRNGEKLAILIKKAQPETVFHLAAQPLVRESYRLPLETFSTNVMGTAHVLNALRGLDGVLAAVMVTTDKVYRNSEWSWAYREDDVLGGHDPYSASKAASEIVISSYRCAYLAEQGVSVASARAGNAIGGGDWSPDRLIPDAVRAWQSGKPLTIRNPNSIRPWQHVLEPLAGYLALASAMATSEKSNNNDLCSAFNFGPPIDATASVKDVIKLAQTSYGSGMVDFEGHINGPHEASVLTLDAAKARSLLNIRPQWPLAEAIRRTMDWYRAQHQGADAQTLCEGDIAEYESLL